MSRRALTPVAVAALAALLTATGCGGGGSSDTATATTSLTPGGAEPVTDVSAGTPSAGGRPGDSGGQTAGPGGGTTGSTGGGATTTGPAASTPTASGPTIGYFRVRQKPSCPGGTTANPIPGSPVVLEWKAGNVDNVALSVDGPGVYADNYPATGSESLNFPCSGEEGDIQRHTYVLTVTNANGKQTKTLVVSAEVKGITPV